MATMAQWPVRVWFAIVVSNEHDYHWAHSCQEVLGHVQGQGRYSSLWKPHLRATERHLPYRITQCYLPPDTSERAPPNPSHAGWYSIYLPWRDGRLSWPSWLDSAPTRSRTSDLSITSPTPNRCTTKTTTCNHSNDIPSSCHINTSLACHPNYYWILKTPILPPIDGLCTGEHRVIGVSLEAC